MRTRYGLAVFTSDVWWARRKRSRVSKCTGRNIQAQGGIEVVQEMVRCRSGSLLNVFLLAQRILARYDIA